MLFRQNKTKQNKNIDYNQFSSGSFTMAQHYMLYKLSRLGKVWTGTKFEDTVLENIYSKKFVKIEELEGRWKICKIIATMVKYDALGEKFFFEDKPIHLLLNTL